MRPVKMNRVKICDKQFTLFNILTDLVNNSSKFTITSESINL